MGLIPFRLGIKVKAKKEKLYFITRPAPGLGSWCWRRWTRWLGRVLASDCLADERRISEKWCFQGRAVSRTRRLVPWALHQKAWVGVPGPLFTTCVTLAKCLISSGLSVHICKVGLVIGLASWDYCVGSVKQVSNLEHDKGPTNDSSERIMTG